MFFLPISFSLYAYNILFFYKTQHKSNPTCQKAIPPLCRNADLVNRKLGLAITHALNLSPDSES